MRGVGVLMEVAMLAAGLGLIWFGSQTLRSPKSPEAGRMLDEAIVLADQAEEAIAEAASLRAAGEVELVYQPRDRQKNAGQDFSDLRGRLVKYTTPAQQASLEAIDLANDPAGARVALARINSQINGRALPIAALAVAGVLIVGVVILERRRKQTLEEPSVAIPAT